MAWPTRSAMESPELPSGTWPLYSGRLHGAWVRWESTSLKINKLSVAETRDFAV